MNGSVKIADFGLSNVMEYGAFLKTSCGSVSESIERSFFLE